MTWGATGGVIVMLWWLPLGSLWSCSSDLPSCVIQSASVYYLLFEVNKPIVIGSPRFPLRGSIASLYATSNYSNWEWMHESAINHQLLQSIPHMEWRMLWTHLEPQSLNCHKDLFLCGNGQISRWAVMTITMLCVVMATHAYCVCLFLCEKSLSIVQVIAHVTYREVPSSTEHPRTPSLCLQHTFVLPLDWHGTFTPSTLLPLYGLEVTPAHQHLQTFQTNYAKTPPHSS
jgi:hypothetical protein